MKNQQPRSLELPVDHWRMDENLRRAAELLDVLQGRLRVVTFDFFDTIVWRLVAKPTDVFYEVGRRLSAKQLLRPGISPEHFETLRRHAEGRARQAQSAKDHTWEDISIEDIYRQLKAIVTNPDLAVCIEHGAECDLCMLNPAMAEFIRYVKGRGLKVAVVSDIYFSAEQLRAILRANGFDPDIFDAMFTSRDAGVCKGTGNLFRRAAKQLGMQPDQMLHIGDNYGADVIGARHAGVRGIHYAQATPDIYTMQSRESFLLGAQHTVFNANSLRMMAARQYPETTVDGAFARMGALIMGPVMTRFASWACKEYVASGVRKVGAFMREGELFGELLRREADALGYNLDIQPLYVNRKATDLAALGKLTANGLITWLEARPTLPIKKILSHLGLDTAKIQNLHFDLDEKADTKERILKLAEYLFTPDIARQIEARSAEERAKVIAYLKPWLESGHPIGLCDIGYSASAQTQLKRIFDLEGIRTPMVGCYLVNYERAADRVLDGLDVRDFLGAFGQPHFYFSAFIRSPAFLEQSFVAGMGTTLGYERRSDGTVVPVLDRMPFAPETLQRQRSFKEGVLWFQQLWHWFRATKPSVLDGQTELSKRILADVDRAFMPILARATSFPLASELARFGDMPLDDYYFANSFKPMCSREDRQLLREKGYPHILGQPGIHWPQGIHAAENPTAASSFFSYGKALLLCQPQHDGNGLRPSVTILVETGRDRLQLQKCLARLRPSENNKLHYEVVLLTPQKSEPLVSAVKQSMQGIPAISVLEAQPQETAIAHLNRAIDGAVAPLLLFLRAGTVLPAGWAETLLPLMDSTPEIGAAFVPVRDRSTKAAPSTSCFLLRRSAFIEGLGFSGSISPFGAAWDLMARIKELRWRIACCNELTAEALQSRAHNSQDELFLGCSQPELTALFSPRATAENPIHEQPAPDSSHASSARAEVAVNWVGSFHDHGSLSHVNRELTRCFAKGAHLQLTPFASGSINPPMHQTSNPDVTVHHSWPPNWTQPESGAWVVIQPWEFGALPKEWVQQFRKVDEAWVPSEYVRRVYVDSGVDPAKVKVVPNGINPATFNPQAKPIHLATKKKFKFLFVGGTIARKGPDVLLKAYLDHFTAADDVCLVIKDFGGKTVYRGQTFAEEIKAAQKQPNAPEILYLDQDLAPEQLPGLYTACDCLVHPYRGEGFGLPVLEAMACELSVIVTGGGATDDFATDEFVERIPADKKAIGNSVAGIPLVHDGWWLEPPATLVGARMHWVFNHRNEARAKAKRASEYVRQEWTWERAAQIALGRMQNLAARKHAEQEAIKQRRARQMAPIQMPAAGKLGNLRAAREFFAAGNFIEAANAVNKAIQQRPFHPEAYLLLAEIAKAQSKLDQARNYAAQARQMAPNWKPGKEFLKSLPGGASQNVKRGENSLSVCLIVKNEERFLAQCLRSVRPLANQIVVVDTGSTDRTIEIAKEFGAEVHSFTWCNDFSAARNAALEHATGDWILVIDADEELPAASLDILKKEMRDSEAMACRLQIIDKGREDEGHSYVPRFFRNAPGLFFIGRVHEQAFSSVEVRRREWGLENRLSKAIIIHHGYDAQLQRDRNKSARNLNLLEIAIEEMPNEPHLLMQYGMELARSGQLETAFENYWEAVHLLGGRLAHEVIPELRETLLTQLATHLLSAKDYAGIQKLFGTPLAKSAALTASMHFVIGLAEMEQGRFAVAAEQMRHVLAKRNENCLSPIHKDIRKGGPNHCLGICYKMLKQPEKALKAFQQAVAEDPQSRPARYDYARFLAEQGQHVDALKSLYEAVQMDGGDTGAWILGAQVALSCAELLEFAGDWTAEAVKHCPDCQSLQLLRGETLILRQDIDGARQILRQAELQGNTKYLAGMVLCEILADGEAEVPTEAEGNISREFLQWYRQLLRVNASELIKGLNNRLENLRKVLPGAAQVLEQALLEADAEAVAA